MLIILDYESDEIVLETSSDEPDKLSDISTSYADGGNSEDPEGTEYLLGTIKDVLFEELSNCYGHYGHIINPDAISNLDLVAAVPQLKEFKLVGKLPELDFEPLPDDVES